MRPVRYFLVHVISEADKQTLLLFVVSDSDPNRLDTEVGSELMKIPVLQRFNPLIAERAPRGKLTEISQAEFDRLRDAKIDRVNVPGLELWWVKE